jgi:hypothetical protein
VVVLLIAAITVSLLLHPSKKRHEHCLQQCSDVGLMVIKAEEDRCLCGGNGIIRELDFPL